MATLAGASFPMADSGGGGGDGAMVPAAGGKSKKRKKSGKGLPADVNKFKRGGDFKTKGISDSKLRGQMSRAEYLNKEAAIRAAKSEILQPHEPGFMEAEGLERTFKFTQEQIKGSVDKVSARKVFELTMEYGPYKQRYTRNGRHLLIGGQKGHVALMEWSTGKVKTELHLRESVRDVSFLHNESLFAVAQKKYCYIYDQKGLEIHCLKAHVEPHRLEFMPYHFLLASVGGAGWLKYQDVSTGELVAELRTGKGRCDCLRQNYSNAVLHAGHGNGTVSLWSPTVNKPLVSMLAHRGPVRQIAVDVSGNYMASTGMDGYAKIWDLRMYRMVHAYTTLRPAEGLDISQSGLLAVGQGPHLQIWKDALQSKQNSPYMSHELPAMQVSDVRFCPFEDVLGVGHSKGFSSLVVPGAAFANYDSFEANPFQTKEQRKEAEIKALLEKLRPDQITLDANFIATVQNHEKDIQTARGATRARKAAEALKAKGWGEGSGSEGEDSGSDGEVHKEVRTKKIKQKKRGRSTAKKRWNNKQANVLDESKDRARKAESSAKIAAEKAAAKAAKGKPSALDRFGS